MQGYPNLNINDINTEVNREALLIRKGNYRISKTNWATGNFSAFLFWRATPALVASFISASSAERKIINLENKNKALYKQF